MLDKRRLVVPVVVVCLFAGSACAEPIAASRGRWTGSIAEHSPGWPVGKERVELRVDGTETRFSVDLGAGGGGLLAGEFAAGARKDVFGPPAAGGLMSWLGRGSAVNPLEGKPLTWARRAGEEIVVYRLELRGGAHRLDRLSLAPAGNRIAVAFERREHDRPPERFGATLERAGR